MLTYPRYLLSSIFVFLAGKVNTLTAGGTGDNTAVTRQIYKLVVGQKRPYSAVVSLNIEATLAAAATLKLTPKIVTDTVNTYDGAGLVTIETFPEITLTGGSGGSTETYFIEYNVDLSECKNFAGIQYTPNLSAANTDTAAIGVTVAQGGFDGEIADMAVYAVTNHPELDTK